jgi:hypothetical protein
MKITVEISDDDAMYINRVIDMANMSNANTHGAMDTKKLVEMLLEDVAMTVRRPGCWEATNMAQVLSSHGYEI